MILVIRIKVNQKKKNETLKLKKKKKKKNLKIGKLKKLRPRTPVFDLKPGLTLIINRHAPNLSKK